MNAKPPTLGTTEAVYDNRAPLKHARVAPDRGLRGPLAEVATVSLLAR